MWILTIVDPAGESHVSRWSTRVRAQADALVWCDEYLLTTAIAWQPDGTATVTGPGGTATLTITEEPG